ncbi:unnamed protein product [Strongylus vulgaris]|uniref:Uncharacterized protein n=1 Tax=Strongylus vulgaris TaxID=40348 RepID=A0A3P7IXC7_STRVU|nr:unnamed protein product [Strongylus vulgaris]
MMKYIIPHFQFEIKPEIRSILLILSILSVSIAVKPIWRTPVTNVRKNATARTQRASNSVPQEGYASQKQVPYYTRTEDFKIPDYRPPKPNVPGSVNPNFVSQFTPGQQPFQPQQSIVSPVTDLFEQHSTRGWYNPTSTSPERSTNIDLPTSGRDRFVEQTSSTQSILAMEINPFTTSSSSSTPRPAENPATTYRTPSPSESNTYVIEDITKNWQVLESVTPSNVRTTSSAAETSDDIYDHTDIVQDDEEGTTVAAPPRKGDLEQAKTNYFPRPATTQVYQPPGHLPEDFTRHIDVNFLKPNRSCTGPLCGVDADKGDAARLGYIPPNPKLISDFTAPPGSTEYYNNRFVPNLNYPPADTSGPFQKGEITTPVPFRAEITPKGPHVFMPPQNFPAPPLPTLVQPSEQTRETTITSTSRPNTLPPFETTTRFSESTPEAYTVPQIPEQFTDTQPPEEGRYTTSKTFPWSPTYKTVPPSTPRVETARTTTVSTPPWTPPSEAPSTPYTRAPETTTTTSFTPFETTTTTVATTTRPTTQRSTEQPTLPWWATELTPPPKPTTRFEYITEETEATTTEYFRITTPSGPPAAPTTSPTPVPTYTSTFSETTSQRQGTTSKTEVMNRVRGKVHVICKEEGIEFGVTTLFPFTGQIFANDRKRVPR